MLAKEHILFFRVDPTLKELVILPKNGGKRRGVVPRHFKTGFINSKFPLSLRQRYCHVN